MQTFDGIAYMAERPTADYLTISLMASNGVSDIFYSDNYLIKTRKFGEKFSNFLKLQIVCGQCVG
jgi:hypothetical protein